MKIEETLLLMIDFQTKLMPSIHENTAVLKSAETLLLGCNILKVPVFVTEQYTKGLGPTEPLLEAHLSTAQKFEKISFSSMKLDAFSEAVKDSGKKNIIVSGVESHICVQQTVLDLLESGYSIYIAADAVSSRRPFDHEFSLERMRQNGAQISTVESLLFELLVYANHPDRKAITNLVK